MSDLISREETIARFVGAMRSREKSEHPMPLTEERIVRFLKAMPPTAEPLVTVKAKQNEGLYLDTDEETLLETEYIVVATEGWYKEYIHETDGKPKVGKWIPCEERMPKAFENPVLVSGYKGYVSLGWWNGKEFETATRLPHIDVKAWQPLPEPYEMERSE